MTTEHTTTGPLPSDGENSISSGSSSGTWHSRQPTSGPHLVNDRRDMPAIAELRTHPQWVAWRYKEIEGANGEKKLTKPPVNPKTGGGASHSKPETWGTFEQARVFTMTRRLPGVGFVLSEGDDYTGIDLDKCRDAKTGVVEPWAQAIIDFNETYTEVSPSGTGIRMIARGKIESAVKVDAAQVEVYGKQRYLTITADHLSGSPDTINLAPKTIAALLARATEFKAKITPPPAEPRTPRPAAAPPVDMFGRRKAGDPLSEQAKKYLEKNAGTTSERARASAKPAGKNNFFRTVNDKALDNLGSWFLILFPTAKAQPGTGGYRVSSKDLGRNLEEDLSVVPGKAGGITDFGVADMGDAQGGARTAIDLVMEWGGAPGVVEAAHWLCEQMGVTPETMGWQENDINDAPANDDTPGAYQDRAQSTGQGDGASNGADAGASGPRDPLAGFVFDGDAASVPPPKLVKGLIGKKEIVFLGGQSGAGKTFVALHLAVCLASATPFFGRKIAERVGVAILAGEGFWTIESRVSVARQKLCGGPYLPITWLGDVPNLANEKEVAELSIRLKFLDAKFRADHGVRLGLVILDTLAATFSLEDENSNSEAARAIRHMKKMGDSLGVTIMPVHHYGKSADTGLRGASAFRAGCDTVISVLADRDQITGQCRNRRVCLAKSRDGAEAWTVPFTLCAVSLGKDEDGDEYSTCYIAAGEEQSAGMAGSGDSGRLKGAAKTYFDALNAVLDKGKKIRPWGMEGPEVIGVERKIVRDEFNVCYPVDADGDDVSERARKKKEALQKAFKRGEVSLTENRRIAVREVNGIEYVWPVREDHPS